MRPPRRDQHPRRSAAERPRRAVPCRAAPLGLPRGSQPLHRAHRPGMAALSRTLGTSVAHIRRQVYGRLYPMLLVKTDGSTVHIRYKEPKKILMLPVDSNTLPEAERRARLRRQFPSKFKVKKEEAFEEINLDEYKRFWKK
ncbi:large ribosomal subunit protein mL55 isoform X2 [Apteryx mantelli]|uniref:Large ribosomal subunit protein mL55 isoform X2 n=1 Tax=Apteryx mantelli TaxID=2696672 RepID=A0ABM4E624_9AVES